MRWIRGGRPLEQVQVKVDPPEPDDEDDRWRPYRGYPVVVVVRGKREVVFVYD